MTALTGSLTDPVAVAAEAVAEVLPAATPLTPGAPVRGEASAAGGYAGAAIAELQLPGAPRIAVLVGADLVQALAGSPMGVLDLAAATQPALDAAAAALGVRCGAARDVSVALVTDDLGGPFTVVPLVGATGAAGALLVSDAATAAVAALDAADAGTTAVPAGTWSSQPSVLPGSGIIGGTTGHRGIEMLHGVDMEVTVELGRTRMTVRDLLALSPGAVLELDRAAGSPADLLVNGRLIARGEVVVVDEDFGLRVTEIIDETTAV
jgi:flagellar motor switch protein FliN/FliY